MTPDAADLNAADFLPQQIEIRRGRRRTVELSLEHGQLVARAPRRITQRELNALLRDLRSDLWRSLRRTYVFDDEALQARARRVAHRRLRDVDLPPFLARFSRRQRKRWGSCVVSDGQGRILISIALVGHPNWVLDHVLLHELIHLRVHDHGDRFHQLMDRDHFRTRAEGYLEALENVERMGDDLRTRLAARVTSAPWNDDGSAEALPLFPPDQSALSARTARPSPPSDS